MWGQLIWLLERSIRSLVGETLEPTVRHNPEVASVAMERIQDKSPMKQGNPSLWSGGSS